VAVQLCHRYWTLPHPILALDAVAMRNMMKRSTTIRHREAIEDVTGFEKGHPHRLIVLVAARNGLRRNLGNTGASSAKGCAASEWFI
jgi:hypothetical protein